MLKKENIRNKLFQYHKKIIFITVLSAIILYSSFVDNNIFKRICGALIRTAPIVSASNARAEVVDNRIVLTKNSGDKSVYIDDEGKGAKSVKVFENKIVESVFDKYPSILDNIYKNKNTEGFVYTPVRVLLDNENVDKKIILKTFQKDNGSVSRFYLRYNGSVYADIDSATISATGDGRLLVELSDGKAITNRLMLIVASVDDYIEIEGMNNIKQFGEKTFNDNRFLTAIDIINNDGILEIVNELDIEDYIKGVAETTANTNYEKMKAMAVIARSYAFHYLSQTDDVKEVLRDKHYTATDDPANFQKYLGYEYTKRNRLWEDAVNETRGLMIYYKEKVLKPAYSSCTSSVVGYRMSAKEAGWGGYFDNVSDVYQKIEDSIGVDSNRNDMHCGHGVGLSGYGAEQLGQEGKTFEEIIKRYYKNIKIH